MEEKIREALTPTLKELGVNIYSISLEPEDGVNTLFIKIEKDGGVVDTDLCATCADIINPIIDSLDLDIEDGYVLDICSKGEENGQ